MKSRSTRIAVIVIATCVGLLGSAYFFEWRGRDAQTHVQSPSPSQAPTKSADGSARRSAARKSQGAVAADPEAGEAKKGSKESIRHFVSQLSADAPSERRGAVARLSEMAKKEPRELAEILPELLDSLLVAGENEAVLTLANAAISQRPNTRWTVAAEQKAKVQALVALRRYDDALRAAKSYYNVARLADSSKAVRLVCDVMDESLAKTDPSAVVRFQTRQFATAAAGFDPLKSIRVDASEYDVPIQAMMTRKETFYTSMGLGNLLLLADQPAQARESFKRCWAYTDGDAAKQREVIEAIARSVRAESGTVIAANDFVLSLQNKKLGQVEHLAPGADADALERAAHMVTLAPVLSKLLPLPSPPVSDK